MDREIKFRVWFRHQEKFQYGGLEMFSSFSFPLSWCEVQRYTGLVDKNHKEIYEGDIVMCGTKKEVCQIVFNMGRYCLVNNNDNYVMDYFEFAGDHDKYRRLIQIEVVGNIFENPNLLEK